MEKAFRKDSGEQLKCSIEKTPSISKRNKLDGGCRTRDANEVNKKECVKGN
jgi:hypothetical protein